MEVNAVANILRSFPFTISKTRFFVALVNKIRLDLTFIFDKSDMLTLCHPGGGPKDPQLSKSPNALKLVFKSGWNVFDFSYIDFMKLSNQKF